MISSFFDLRAVDVTASTNLDLKRLAKEGAREGTVLLARRQTAGRGRQGRVWESPEGNLYLSILLRPSCTVREAGVYSFIASLAVFETVKAFARAAQVEIKWPNDVLVGGKKICGILLETNLTPDRKVDWLVLGVGINVLRHPEGLPYAATSLAAEGAKTDPQTVLEVFLRHFEIWLHAYDEEGFAQIRSAWRARARTGRITARLTDCEIVGEFMGVDEDGHLILRLDDGTEKAISAADVFFPEN
jgi:BirA family biotin operon repressor/biotin-[acetyl-CoA-carboxylase] ligase